MTTIKKYSPYDSAFLKLYFVNMFQPNTAKLTTFDHAQTIGMKMAKIANKLTPSELDYLIKKIEEQI